ncbi:hypothetical protein [Erythrobacter aureus]|uniref:hypothetical protein n=1 Tax=Erythrobacter aureus TaxID=2182384 RepID=UPI003A8E2BD1
MADYQKTDLPYAPLGQYKVWVESRNHFDASDLKKDTAADSDRQAQFISELKRLADHLGTATLPVFVQWPNVGRRRMDKGCVGHAVASGALEPPQNSAKGFVEHVALNGWTE